MIASRSTWERDLIAEGLALVERALRARGFGPYTLQAAIAAVHAEAADAAAVAMRDGPQAGLALIDAILERGDLEDYPLAHSARADLCRRLGTTAEARAAYERALELTRQDPERRFLERRLDELTDPGHE